MFVCNILDSRRILDCNDLYLNADQMVYYLQNQMLSFAFKADSFKRDGILIDEYDFIDTMVTKVANYLGQILFDGSFIYGHIILDSISLEESDGRELVKKVLSEEFFEFFKTHFKRFYDVLYSKKYFVKGDFKFLENHIKSIIVYYYGEDMKRFWEPKFVVE